MRDNVRIFGVQADKNKDVYKQVIALANKVGVQWLRVLNGVLKTREGRHIIAKFIRSEQKSVNVPYYVEKKRRLIKGKKWRTSGFPIWAKELLNLISRNFNFWPVFSRRFMKWNTTIIMTAIFFNPHELTKIVLKNSTKYYCTKLHHLAERTEPKRFFLFSRVTYHTRRDQRVPPFNFFRHCETFFRKNFPPKGPPFNFFLFFAASWSFTKPEGSSLFNFEP